MAGKRFARSALAVGVAISLSWAVPASADPTPTILIGGHDTGIPVDCARAGTGANPGPNARWNVVPLTYTVADETVAGETSPAVCGAKILAALDDWARLEETPAGIDWNVFQQFRNALFSGRVNLARPYETFLNNLYITGPVIASLGVTGPDEPRGLGSCEFLPHRSIIRCDDDAGGRIMMRDQWGNPLRDLAGEPIYLYLSGGLSQNGGTTYASVFLRNTDGNMAAEPTLLVQQHEQVHAQQWAQHGWDFGGMYISESLGDPGDAWWHWLTTGATRNPVCFNIYERAASFAWAGYACPSSWT